MAYQIRATSAFKKSYKRMKKRGLDLTKLETVVDLLAGGHTLPEKYRDHALTGNWVGHRECHLEPDWLLIYYTHDDLLVLTLAETGSHADLF